MEFFTNFVARFFNGLTSGLGAVVKAALILLAAFIVASIVKSIIGKLLNKPKVSAMLGKLESGSEPGSIKTFILKLVYLLVFLLFVPGILGSLGLQQVSSPITNLLNSVWGYVPNIVAAIIVLIVGFMIAKLVRQLLVPLFDKLNINKLQEKAGIEVSDSSKLSSTLAYVVYVLILIPMIIMALDVLDIKVISQPATSMLSSIITFIPSIFVALIIITIGVMIGKFVGQIVSRLIASAGLDAKLVKLLDGKQQNFTLSKFVGTVVNVVVIIFFVVEGLNVLQLDVLTNIGSMVIAYMPSVLSAIVIFAICYFASSIAEKALRKSGFGTFAMIAKIAILTVGGFMILSQLGIAANIVNTAFELVLAALAIAFAIAFGVGGRDFAANALKKLEDNADKKDEQ